MVITIGIIIGQTLEAVEAVAEAMKDVEATKAGLMTTLTIKSVEAPLPVIVVITLVTMAISLMDKHQTKRSLP